MKKIIVAASLLILVACKNQTAEVSVAPSVDDVKETKSPIEGTWKMVYGEIREKDSLQIKDLSNTSFIKIINASHFAFFNQNTSGEANFYGGGGTYELNGDAYAETLSYTSVDGVRGHRFPFTVEFKGDTLIQYGLEEVKKANIKRHIVEKYIRIE
ncbi:hypothetical protein ACFSTE_14995 [Aquimarina hainanensis]|uniref:Lipocalin-like domain-containing protein n=1 Tax=Aquimarina hainanensis TaxID=1578017 RepID=A0ABW5N9B0_9FLAO